MAAGDFDQQSKVCNLDDGKLSTSQQRSGDSFLGNVDVTDSEWSHVVRCSPASLILVVRETRNAHGTLYPVKMR